MVQINYNSVKKQKQRDDFLAKHEDVVNKVLIDYLISFKGQITDLPSLIMKAKDQIVSDLVDDPKLRASLVRGTRRRSKPHSKPEKGDGSGKDSNNGKDPKKPSNPNGKPTNKPNNDGQGNHPSK